MMLWGFLLLISPSSASKLAHSASNGFVLTSLAWLVLAGASWVEKL